MEINMKEIGKMEKDTALEFYSIKVEIYILEIGIMTKKMAKEN
jgi:hypothetical protein